MHTDTDSLVKLFVGNEEITVFFKFFLSIHSVQEDTYGDWKTSILCEIIFWKNKNVNILEKFCEHSDHQRVPFYH